MGQSLALLQRPEWLRLSHSLLDYEGLEGDLPMFVFPKETPPPRVGRSTPRYHGAPEDQDSRLLYLSIILARFCSRMRFGVCLV